MQIGSQKYKGNINCALGILKTEGISSFYVSYPTTLLMNIPYHAIHFPAYEFMSKLLNPSKLYDPKTHMISGAIAGGVASALTKYKHHF